MPWTATIVDKALQGDRVEVGVVLSDGTTKFIQHYSTDGTLASLRPQVLATIAQTDRRKTADDLVVGAAISTTPDAVVTPVDPDPARTQFLLDYRRYQHYQRGVSAGLLDGNSKLVTDLAASLLARFDLAYAELL